MAIGKSNTSAAPAFSAPAASSVNANDITRIAAGTVIKGDLSSAGDLRVDGVIEGTLFSKGKIVVGEKAYIKGAVFGTVVDFFGTVDGDIFTRDTLSLKNTALVNGDLHVARFQIDLGGRLNGKSNMVTPDEYDKLVEQHVTLKLLEKTAQAE